MSCPELPCRTQAGKKNSRPRPPEDEDEEVRNAHKLLPSRMLGNLQTAALAGAAALALTALRPPQALRGMQDELQSLMAALGLPAGLGESDDPSVPSLQVRFRGLPLSCLFPTHRPKALPLLSAKADLTRGCYAMPVHESVP